MSKERAHEVCLEMLEQRGYTIVDTENIMALKADGSTVVVFFNDSPSFDTKSMKEIFFLMNQLDNNHSIVIYKEKITPATKSILSQSNEMRVELFMEEDLQYNITKHRLQPIFEKLSDNEASDFKKKYGVKFDILRVDRPISRFYDYKKGDVIRIIRKDGYINYRIVKG